jgi:tetratricopeptide (TPR) repeat protein
MVLNNDTMAAPQMVRRLLDGLRSDGRIGMAGPVSNRVKGPARVRVGTIGESEAERLELEALLGKRCRGQLEDVETLAGLCLFFERGLLDRVGLFDEGFGPGNFEDDDYSLRVRLTGRRLVIVRDAFLYHRGMRTFSSMGLDYEDELRSRFEVFCRKWAHDPAGAAHIAHRENSTEKAAAWARHALGIHPSWPDAHLLLGCEAAEGRRHREAIDHLRSFLACCPLHPGALTLLAFQTLATGDDVEGMRLILWILENCYLTGADLGKILLAYGRWCLDQGRATDAILALSDASGLDPDNGHLLNLLGIARLKTGAAAAAIPSLEQALELGASEARTNLGLCFWELGDRGKAIEHFHRAAQEDPDDPGAVGNLERALAAGPAVQA